MTKFAASGHMLPESVDMQYLMDFFTNPASAKQQYEGAFYYQYQQ